MRSIHFGTSRVMKIVVRFEEGYGVQTSPRHGDSQSVCRERPKDPSHLRSCVLACVEPGPHSLPECVLLCVGWPIRGCRCHQWCRWVYVCTVKVVGGVHSKGMEGEHDQTLAVISLSLMSGGLMPRILFGVVVVAAVVCVLLLLVLLVIILDHVEECRPRPSLFHLYSLLN